MSTFWPNSTFFLDFFIYWMLPLKEGIMCRCRLGFLKFFSQHARHLCLNDPFVKSRLWSELMYFYWNSAKIMVEIWRWAFHLSILIIRTGAVHKLCRLKNGDFWPPPHFPPSLSSFYKVKSAIFGPPPPLLRRHSLWTAPSLFQQYSSFLHIYATVCWEQNRIQLST